MYSAASTFLHLYTFQTFAIEAPFSVILGRALKLLWMLEGGTCTCGNLQCLGSQHISAAVCLGPRHPTSLTMGASQAIPDPVSLASAVRFPDSVTDCMGHG